MNRIFTFEIQATHRKKDLISFNLDSLISIIKNHVPDHEINLRLLDGVLIYIPLEYFYNIEKYEEFYRYLMGEWGQKYCRF